MADVFVSYASEDRSRVEPIVAAIERAGFSVWWDRQIGLGASFDREIERQLDAAGCVVVVWSRHSVESDWVRNEAQEGLDRGVLVPVAIDDTRPPLAFRRAQTAALKTPVGAAALAPVVDAVASVVGRGVAGPHRSDDGVAEMSGAPTAEPFKPPAKGNIAPVALVRFKASDAEAELLVDGLMDSVVARFEGAYPITVVADPGTLPSGSGVEPSYVVTGSVRRASGRIRVSCRITGIQQGTEVASTRRDVNTDDVLEAEDQLELLGSWILGTIDRVEGDYLETLPVEQLDARGLARVGQRIPVTDEASRDKKLAMLKRATEIDPRCGGAYADVMFDMIKNSFLRLTDDLREELIALVDTAVEHAPTNEFVLFRASEIHRAFGDVNLSYALAKRADEGTHLGYSYNSLVAQHRLDEAIGAAIERGAGPAVLALLYQVAGQLEAAEASCRESVGRWPSGVQGWVSLANVLALEGKERDALEALAKVKALAPGWTLPLQEKGMRIHWRNDEAIVDALVNGLRMLDRD